jgi:PadR family transcriptional regulator AphA
LSLAEWVVLSVVGEKPTHGFAIASLTGPGGELGRVWRLRRAVVYRGLQRLQDLGLVSEIGIEATSHGPARTLVRATPDGEEAVRWWLARPVEHVRDVRSELMIKLALLDRAGRDTSALLTAQRHVIEPIAEALRADRDQARGFDRTLAGWRYETAVATLAFLDEVLAMSR